MAGRLGEHQGFVDADDDLVIILLKRPCSEGPPVTAVGGSKHARVGESRHEVDIGVSKPNEKLFRPRESSNSELELGRQFDPPPPHAPPLLPVPVPA